MKRIINYGARDLQLVSGQGCRVTDAHGKSYLDFLAGWCVGTLGWQHHAVTAAMRKQAERGFFTPSWFQSDRWEAFAATLTGIMPDKRLNRVFRCTSGSEAIELAIKAARAATGRKTIVSLDRVYHGHTYGAASVGNALSDAIAPGVPGFMKLPLPDSYRGLDTADVLNRLEQLFRVNHDIAAFLSEPVFTNAGAIIPPRDFFPAVANLCRQHGVKLIMDEVATGFGRCGTLFASSLWDLKPDMICLGKGMTGGYGTMGAVVVTEEIARAAGDVPATSTFGWSFADLAAAEAVVGVVLRERLWENAHRVGMYLQERLRLLESRPYVGQVRGQGLLIGIEIVKDKEAKQPDDRRAEQLADRCADEGLILDWAGNTLFISPPLILSTSEADAGAEILSQALH